MLGANHVSNSENNDQLILILFMIYCPGRLEGRTCKLLLALINLCHRSNQPVFMPKLLSAVLTHHRGWVATVCPPNEGTARRVHHKL